MSSRNSELSHISVNSVSRETHERLTVYHDVLKVWQRKINLISPTTVDEIWERHIEDSLQCCVLAGTPDHVVDIGSGAGLPGLVQAIFMAENATGKVDLVESNGKKCAFMNTVIREIGLKSSGVDVTIHNGRIEDVLPKLQPPDVVTARALASLNDLLGLTERFLSNGSFAVFPKGRAHAEEIEEARKVWDFDCEIQKSKLDGGSVLLKISDLSRH